MDTLEARAQDIHERVGVAVRTQRASMHTLAQLLLELDRDELYRSLGYTTLRDYAWSEHELGARQVRELLNIARRLDQLPALDAAMASREVPWTKARTMLSVLDADNESDWVERAKGLRRPASSERSEDGGQAEVRGLLAAMGPAQVGGVGGTLGGVVFVGGWDVGVGGHGPAQVGRIAGQRRSREARTAGTVASRRSSRSPTTAASR